MVVLIQCVCVMCFAFHHSELGMVAWVPAAHERVSRMIESSGYVAAVLSGLSAP